MSSGRLRGESKNHASKREPAESWPVQRERALERDGHQCRAADYGLDTPCQSFPPGPVVHHIRRRKGQPDVHALEGLITLCGYHHWFVHANVALSYELGLLQRTTHTEAAA